MGVQTLPVHCLKSFTSNSIYPPSSPALRISTSGQEWFACCRKHGYAAISPIEHPFFLSESHGDEVCFDFWSTALPAQAKIDPICCPTRSWNKILVPFWGCPRNVPTNTPVTFKEEYTPGVRDFSVVKIFNRTFYRYGGHIEFIRFKEYYGMPRGALAQYLCALFGQKENFNVYFSGKRRSSLYPNTAQRSFFPITIFF